MQPAVEPPIGDFLRVAKVSQMTGLSERTVRQMLADGRLPAIRPTGVRIVCVPASAVRALMGLRERLGRRGAENDGGGAGSQHKLTSLERER